MCSWLQRWIYTREKKCSVTRHLIQIVIATCLQTEDNCNSPCRTCRKSSQCILKLVFCLPLMQSCVQKYRPIPQYHNNSFRDYRIWLSENYFILRRPRRSDVATFLAEGLWRNPTAACQQVMYQYIMKRGTVRNNCILCFVLLRNLGVIIRGQSTDWRHWKTW